jgi:flagellin-like hook-associated protein FlgL
VLGEGSENGVNVVMAMKTLLEGLESNTSHLIQQSLAMLTKANDQLSFARADLAGRMQQISRVLNTHTEQNITTTDTVSKIEDADAIKVFSDLARDQTVLQSAISTSKKILSENPVDILFK